MSQENIDGVNSKGPNGEEGYGIKEIGFDTASLAATHPLSYVKCLIQLGHEPLAPYTGREWAFWKTRQFRPGFLPYAGHIVRQDGFFGIWRGFTPRLGSSIIFNLARKNVSSALDKVLPFDKQEATENDEPVDALLKLSKKCVRFSLYEAIAIAIAHPLYVLSVRSMAQFITRQEAYNSWLSSVLEIYDNEGITGFFAGITPKILGAALGIWLTEFVSYGIKKCWANLDEEAKKPFTSDEQTLDFKKFSPVLATLLTSFLTYPFQLTSVIMATGGSRLNIATKHVDWADCLKELKSLNQTQRGSAVVFGRKLLHIAAFAWRYSDITTCSYQYK